MRIHEHAEQCPLNMQQLLCAHFAYIAAFPDCQLVTFLAEVLLRLMLHSSTVYRLQQRLYQHTANQMTSADTAFCMRAAPQGSTVIMRRAAQELSREQQLSAFTGTLWRFPLVYIFIFLVRFALICLFRRGTCAHSTHKSPSEAFARTEPAKCFERVQRVLLPFMLLP